MSATPPTPSRSTIAIIGAGFSGICMGIRLKMAGIEDFTIYDKGRGPGGVWRDNTYPGAACDIPSSLYSYSFESSSDWSRKFPEQPEILRYLRACVGKYGLGEHAFFETEIISAVFDEKLSHWSIELASGETQIFSVVIFACGQLNRPLVPELPGLETFQGEAFHSARWNHQVDLKDKRIAVIGNGASAVQFVPIIAEQASQLCVYQRSPNWIMRKRDKTISEVKQERLRRFPVLQKLRRLWTFLTFEPRFALFGKNNPTGWLFEKYLRGRLNRRIPDVKLKSALTPDFAVGCKRILLSGEWFKTLQRPNVRLNPSGASRVNATSVIGEDDASFGADVIIFATGFQSLDFLAPMAIVGRGDRLLSKVWEDGAEAHLGISVSGFPNLFLLYGPNTNLGHNSVVMMIEAQARYILQAIEIIRAGEVKTLEVKIDVMRAFNDRLQQSARRTVWTGHCRSWYKTGSGKVVNNWPRASWRYLLKTRRLRRSDFVEG